MSGRRIELSATQVVASMLAAVTGAIAASYTGIAGTVIGVAVMSVASTAGAAVYKHYLARSQEKLLASKERLHAAAVMMAPRSAHNGAAGHHDRPTASGPVREQGEQAQGTGELASAAVPGFAVGRVGWLLSPDSPGTDEFPAVSGETSRWSNSPAETAKPAEPAESAEPDGPAGSDGPAAVSAKPAEPDGPAGSDGSAGSAGPAESAKTAGSHHVWPRWPSLLAAAFGVFVLALATITVFEVAAGKPLEALIWGRSGGGTTVGVLTGAQHTGPATRAKPHPARSGSTPTVAPSPSPSATSSQSLSPSPSPTPTPTPTASSSPSPSGAASQGQ
jgi:hypothetical protein